MERKGYGGLQDFIALRLGRGRCGSDLGRPTNDWVCRPVVGNFSPPPPLVGSCVKRRTIIALAFPHLGLVSPLFSPFTTYLPTESSVTVQLTHEWSPTAHRHREHLLRLPRLAEDGLVDEDFISEFEAH
jgi:hypothetical protein